MKDTTASLGEVQKRGETLQRGQGHRMGHGTTKMESEGWAGWSHGHFKTGKKQSYDISLKTYKRI